MTATTSRTTIAMLSAAILILVFSISVSETVRLFCLEHPGILIVVIAVAGEVGCDWNRKKTLKERLKKFFGFLLVAGLLLEIAEAVKLDKDVSSANLAARQAERETGQAKLQVAVLSNQTVRLGIELEVQKSNNTVLATQLIETSNNAVKANPLNQPIATISAMVWLVTAGTDRTGYTNLNNLKINQTCIDLNENGGNPDNIQLSFGRHDQIKNGWPVLCLAASWTQLGTTTTGEECRFWHLEFREVAQRPPSQRELVREAANWDAYELEARFLPPNSIVLNGGNLTLTINSITQPTIPILAQYARGQSAYQDFLNNPPIGVTVFCQ